MNDSGAAEGKSKKDGQKKGKFSCWILRDCASGLAALGTAAGTLLLGVAASYAACQTNDLFSEVLKIQRKSDEISSAVADVKAATTQLNRGQVVFLLLVVLLAQLLHRWDDNATCRAHSASTLPATGTT
ncbi:MAG: hypothetical protein IPJ88_15350 [Myxococcales bacterium]|nr:MAG: hypothetical protein IPJ88_15350 [Myxococcales bacterium]